MSLKASASWPISFRLRTRMADAKSPAATRSTPAVSCFTGRRTTQKMKPADSKPAARAVRTPATMISRRVTASWAS